MAPAVEAFDQIAGYGVVEPLLPIMNEVELLALVRASALTIAKEARISGEAAARFLSDPATGRAFGATILLHRVLDPECRVEHVIAATIRDWKKLGLPPAAAKRFGAEGRQSRLRTLAAWHAQPLNSPRID